MLCLLIEAIGDPTPTMSPPYVYLFHQREVEQRGEQIGIEDTRDVLSKLFAAEGRRLRIIKLPWAVDSPQEFVAVLLEEGVDSRVWYVGTGRDKESTREIAMRTVMNSKNALRYNGFGYKVNWLRLHDESYAECAHRILTQDSRTTHNTATRYKIVVARPQYLPPIDMTKTQ